LADKEFINRNVEPIISEKVGKLFKKHNIKDNFAVTLLHRHCDLTPDQRLVKVGPVMLPWSSFLTNFVEPMLGKISPQALLVHDGKFYPYEFIHLSAAEANKLPNQADDEFGNYSEFLTDFATVVKEENVDDLIGLRLLSDEDKRLAADPSMCSYEVENNGELECVAITLMAGPELLGKKGFLRVSWMFANGVLRGPTGGCLGGICGGHKGCSPQTCTECDPSAEKNPCGCQGIGYTRERSGSLTGTTKAGCCA
jgi:hypothetical protein